MSGFVYFVQCHDRVKIGFSLHPALRLVKISTDAPYECKLLGVVDADEFPERELHERFAAYRKRGEWFLAVAPILDFIAGQCEPLPEPPPELPEVPTVLIAGSDVKALRASFGETQAEFSKRIGVTPLTISQWECIGPPKRGAAKKLLTAMLGEGA